MSFRGGRTSVGRRRVRGARIVVEPSETGRPDGGVLYWSGLKERKE